MMIFWKFAQTFFSKYFYGTFHRNHPFICFLGAKCSAQVSEKKCSTRFLSNFQFFVCFTQNINSAKHLFTVY